MGFGYSWQMIIGWWIILNLLKMICYPNGTKLCTSLLLRGLNYLKWGEVKIGGPEQAPGPHPFHTPVPYLLEGSVPYLCSIPLIHTLWYIYIFIYIYVSIWICAVWFYICTRILERTYIHECLHARIRLLCPSPVIVLVSLCLRRLLCDGRDVLGCCQLAV